MAYIHDYTYASDDANVAAHTGELPDYAPGDLLIWIAAKDSTTGTNLVLPTGWTSVYQGQLKNEVLVCYKFAQAGETPPTTSSSDTDAYQSSMYCIRGARQTSPVSTADTLIDNVAAAYTEYAYYKPAGSIKGNLHFAVLNPSGVGGASIENFGKRYINDETTGMALVIHANTITDPNNVPTVLGVSQHTSAGMIQFEVFDDGSDLSDPVCYNDFDIIELATDDMVNGSTLGNSSLTTLDGLNVVAPGLITAAAGDIGFIPVQKAPSIKGVKGLQYTACEVTLSAAVDLSTDLLAVDVYPVKPKYQPTIGIGTQGRFIYLMDAAGNYKAFNIDSADNKILNFAMQFTYIIDPKATPFASVGSVNLSAITKIGFGERSRSIVCYLAFNRIYRYRKSTIISGSATKKASFSTLLEYQDGSYYRPNLLQGQDILVQVPIEIGDGTIDLVFQDEGKIIEFPAPWNVSTKDYLFHQAPNRSGINFNLSASSSVTLNNMVVQGLSEWYWTSSNTSGTITVTNSTISGAGVVTLTSNMSFSGMTFFDDAMITGALDIVDSTISNPKGTYALELDNIITLRNIQFKNFSGRYALYIPATVTGTISVDSLVSDGSGIDVYWAGTSGTLTISNLNSSNLSTYASAGGTVVFVTTRTKTITGIPSGAEARVVRGAYTLGYEDNITDGDFVFNYTPDNREATIRITLGGYIIEPIKVVLDDQNQVLPATVSPDPSYI